MKKITGKSIFHNVAHPPSKQESSYQGLQRPIKLQTPVVETSQFSEDEMNQWIQSVTEEANNPQFNKVIEILKSDKELEPLLYDHKDLLEALSEIKTLTSKQMLSLLSVAEKEYYESSYLDREKLPSEAVEEMVERLEDETRRRVEAEKALADLKESQPNESEIFALKTTNDNLLEEKKGLVKLIDEQSKYLKDLERLQKELLDAQTQKSSLIRSKERLEEDDERNKKVIEELRQEIGLLQQEKENLTRKLVSTNSQTGSVPFNRKYLPEKYTSPLVGLEELKLAASSSQCRLRRSQSLDSSLIRNRHLSTLLMESHKAEEFGQLGNFFADNSFGEREKYTTQELHQGRPFREPKSSAVKRNEESFAENEKLKEVIKTLEKRNQELALKLSALEQQVAYSASSILPTFAGSVEDTRRVEQRSGNYGSHSPLVKEGEGEKLGMIFRMVDDIGDILRVQPLEVVYDKRKEAVDNLAEYVAIMRQRIQSKEQTRELERTLMEGKRVREKTKQWQDAIERLEIEANALRDENEILRKQKYRNEMSKGQAELLEGQLLQMNRLRDENLEMMEKYEKAVKEIYELKLQAKSATTMHEKARSREIKSASPHKAIGELTDQKLKLEEQLLHSKEKIAKLNEKLLGYKDRNELLKEELVLQKDKNRKQEKQIMSYVKRTSSLSQEVTVKKHDYKSIAANYGQLTHTLKKLKKENKELKNHINKSIL